MHEPGTFRPLLQAEQGQVFLYVLDHIGAPRELLDAQGRVVWAAAHRAWGRLAETQVDPAASHARPVASPFRQLGHYADDETGLHCTRFRYWDPDVARWLSPEPLGLDGGTAMFGLGGSPAFLVDPLGARRQKSQVRRTRFPTNGSRSPKSTPSIATAHTAPRRRVRSRTLLPKEWSEAEFLAAVQQKANDPTITRTPVDEAHGGIGETAFEPITINGVTRRSLLSWGCRIPRFPERDPA